MEKVIVGLGNPGIEYEMTRHNMGFLVVNRLADMLGVTFKRDAKFEGRIATAVFNGVKVGLLLPETYMNESGRAVVKYLHYHKLEPSQLIVVVDDMDLPFAELRVRSSGTSGGHNGLKSIEASLNTIDYPRLKIGIGRGIEAVDHVLGQFTKEESEKLTEVISRSVECLKEFVK